MADLGKKYEEILKEIEKKISNKNELEFIKQKMAELNMEYINSINQILQIERNQNKIENKIRILQNEIANIQDDIYITDENDDEYGYGYGYDQMHDNDYEFEITCPYCNYEFVTDYSYQNQKQIECPKCHKMIELDWHNNCDGECEHCKNYDYTEDKIAEQQEDYNLNDNNNINNDNNNEDDM